MTPTETRLACLAKGYPPIPLIGKRPAFDSWSNCEPTESIIAVWGRNFPDATNTGVLCRRAPFLDFDILIQVGHRRRADLQRMKLC
jgi:hypothetical protein